MTDFMRCGACRPPAEGEPCFPFLGRFCGQFAECSAAVAGELPATWAHSLTEHLLLIEHEKIHHPEKLHTRHSLISAVADFHKASAKSTQPFVMSQRDPEFR